MKNNKLKILLIAFVAICLLFMTWSVCTYFYFLSLQEQSRLELQQIELQKQKSADKVKAQAEYDELQAKNTAKAKATTEQAIADYLEALKSETTDEKVAACDKLQIALDAIEKTRRPWINFDDL